jgi:hypothetical protein
MGGLIRRWVSGIPNNCDPVSVPGSLLCQPRIPELPVYRGASLPVTGPRARLVFASADRPLVRAGRRGWPGHP